MDAPMPADPLSDEDLQLALYVCYELHYRGLPGVSDDWEWEPSLLALRRRLEARFEAGLIGALGAPEGEFAAAEMDVALRAVEAADDAPSLSRHLEREGTHAEMLEFLVHRSAYQLKEADPHSWALPRLTGAPKAAMVEIQADEYGGGNAERMHTDVLWGARALVELEGRFARRLLDAWAQGRTSLLERVSV
jgi:Iron-containing redox enzyme